jgi:hypothetical protein
MAAFKAHAYAFPTLSPVYRYTATGETDSYGDPCYIKDLGTLSSKNGFIVTLFAYDTVCASGLGAISGQPVMQFAIWDIYSPSNFKRSKQTYTIEGAPYVAILSKSGAPYIKKPNVSLRLFEVRNNVVWDKAVEGVKPEDYDFGNEQTYPARFLIELDEVSGQDTKVFYTISGTAKHGKDYAKLNGYVMIPAGEYYTSVFIDAIDDTKKEKIEKVTLKLKANKSYKINTPKSVSVEVLDND